MLILMGRAGRAAGTRAAILAATHELVTAGSSGYPTAGEVATRAGVSRLSVYHHFGSHAGLLEALAAENRPLHHPNAEAGVLEDLQASIRRACEHWARDPALFRRLPAAAELGTHDQDRQLAQRLAAEDRLRPGCSLKEAEDVIALVTSFAAFDRLQQGGRRSIASVVEILVRMAGAILIPPA
jgi:AcrR family transcriptional regulator